MKPFLFSLLLILVSKSYSQSPQAWIEKNVIPISTTNQYVDNSKEYESLKQLLKGKEIVLLGEEDHVFATSFESKTKLIKFLHDQMGFTVLAFEYDLYSLADAYDEAVRINKSSEISNTLYPFWGKVKSTESLYPYILSTVKAGSKPLKVIGFDNQTAPRVALWDSVHAYLQKRNSIILQYDYYQKYLELFKKMYSNLYQTTWKEKDKLLLFNVMDDILVEMDLDPKLTKQDKILKQALFNFKQNINFMWLDAPSNYHMFGQPKPPDSVYGFAASRASMGSLNRRDKMMAENIRWIKETLYPGEKIIIWAASEHTMYNRHLAQFHNLLVDSSFAFNSRFTYNKGYKTMGTYLKEFFGDKCYSLGFTTLSGTVNYDRTGNNNYLGEITIADHSLEAYLTKLKTPNGILNLDKKQLPKEISDSTLFHNIIGGNPNISGNISSFFDGIYFIRKMTPLEFIKK